MIAKARKTGAECVILLIVLCLYGCQGKSTINGVETTLPIVETRQPVGEFNVEIAKARLREHVDSIPPSQGATIARTPDMDVAGLLAFSVMPSTGLAGEVIYLVGPDEMLSSGVHSTFDTVMQRLGVGKTPDVLDVHRFAQLFLRLRANRHGVVLDSFDGHPLLKPDQLPKSKFSLPAASFDENGTRYRFWIFDTDHLEPYLIDALVAEDGTTTFMESGAPAN
ncbi:MAG: hypothetical protein JXA42_13930 [Anaerolineales bacterium]|nr:hypothetical protein [Anaerolineales bacterium]